MAYDTQLAERVRTYLSQFEKYDIEEKEMFRGLAFMVNGKMCVNVSGEDLMCRFDHSLLQEVAVRKGYQPMIMKGTLYKGYCYVEPPGFKNKKDFEYWINLCLAFNEQAKASNKKSK